MFRPRKVSGDSMDKVTDTWITAPKRPAPPTNRDACLVHIYPTGAAMGMRYSLGDKAVVLGRGEDSDIRISDQSVSRRHARIEPGPEGYFAIDLQSTNGTFVNNSPVTMSRLADGDYLRVGNCIYRFLAGGNVETEYHEEIYRLTIHDALTGIHNKRYLLELLDRELDRATRACRRLTLIRLDSARVKAINDLLGHLGGDFALRELATCAQRYIRREELFARYGGEEFAVVIVESNPAGAQEVAERIRRLVEEYPFQYEGKGFQLTVSAGVACTSGDSAMTATELLRQADEKLYQAKNAGRNRVVG